MRDIAYDVNCGVVLIEQRCAEGQVGWHLFDGGSPRRPTNGDPPALLHQWRLEGLKISGRKVVCELLLAGRLLDFLFTHFFDNRFDEFGDCQKRPEIATLGLFSFHNRISSL
jgi:hypothetical protein